MFARRSSLCATLLLIAIPAVQADPEVDYLLQVVIRNIRSYETFLRNHLLQLPTVREVHSQIALSQLKYTTALPLFDLG